MSQIYSGNLLNKVINISTSGNNTLISAPANGYIVIDHINLVNTSSVGVTFKSGTTALSGTYPLSDKQPITLENVMQNEQGIITCNPGDGFVINLDSAVQVSGFIRYRIIG